MSNENKKIHENLSCLEISGMLDKSEKMLMDTINK
jgi:hypothetical protein